MMASWLRSWKQRPSRTLYRRPRRPDLRLEVLEERAVPATSLVSQHLGSGVAGGGESKDPVFSPNGLYLAYHSDGKDIVPGDTNNASDVFLYNIQNDTTLRVSNGNLKSEKPRFSPDSQYLVFVSEADLVANDTNGKKDVYLYQISAGTVTLVSTDPFGQAGDNESDKASFSSDGSKIIFQSGATNLVSGDGNGKKDVFVRDLSTGTITLVSAVNGGTSAGNQESEVADDRDWASDGRYVVFHSKATDLGAGATNAAKQVYVRDLLTSTTILVSQETGTGGAVGNSDSEKASLYSSGGQLLVLFESKASNLASGDTNDKDVFLRDLNANTTILVSAVDGSTTGLLGDADKGVFNADGTKVLFQSSAALNGNDANGTKKDIYLRDLTTNATILVSAINGGIAGGNDESEFHPLQAFNGSLVVFQSRATNLAAGTVGGKKQIFVRDLSTSATTMLTSGGDGDSEKAIVNAAGTQVGFISSATNLVLGDSNNAKDIFLYDLAGGSTTWVSVNSGGGSGSEKNKAEKPAWSADGRYVAFEAEANDILPGDANGQKDIFLRDLQLGTTILVSRNTGGGFANGKSDKPVFSADGTKLLFQSDASDLVAGDTNGKKDVFLFDIATQTVTRVSTGPGGVEGDGNSDQGDFNADGTKIVFSSEATNLVPGDTNATKDVFVKDLATGSLTLISVGTGGVQGNGKSDKPAISPDGRYVAFFSEATNLAPGDLNGTKDIFLHDLQTSMTFLVSRATTGFSGAGKTEENAWWSPDGKFFAFDSEASDLVANDTNNAKDVFIYEIASGQNTLVSATFFGFSGNGKSDKPVWSADSSKLAFQSEAENLVTNDANGKKDVFVYDVQTGDVTLASAGLSGNSGNGESGNPSFGANSKYLAFDSDATDLAPFDTNNLKDVFVRNLDTGATVLLSKSTAGVAGNGKSEKPMLSPLGDQVVFESEADNLATGDPNGKSKDVYLADLPLDNEPFFTVLTVTPNPVNEGSQVSLSLTFSPGNIEVSHTVTIKWGDGQTTIVQLGAGALSTVVHHTYFDDNPTATPIDPYTIEVKVRDDFSELTDTDTRNLQVANVAPTADAGSDQTVDVNSFVSLFGSFTDPGIDDTHTLSWEVRNAANQIVATGSGASMGFLASMVGSYTATLTVTDDDGGTSTDTVSITVQPTAPSFTGDDLELDFQIITEGQTAQLDGSFESFDATASHQVTITWGEGAPTILTLGPGVRIFDASHLYKDDNPTATPSDAYIVTVTITNTTHSLGNSANTTIVVQNADPTVNAGPDQEVRVRDGVPLAVQISDVGVEDTHTVSWVVRDASNAVVATGNGNNYTFTPTKMGTYTAFVTVTDDDTGPGTDSVTIVVKGRPILVTGTGVGRAGRVRVYDAVTRNLLHDLRPFHAAYRGGVRVAAGDVTNDGIADIIVARASAVAVVRVFDGVTGAAVEGTLGRFQPFGTTKTGGAFVAGGDVNADGFVDVIVSAATGPARVLVLSGEDGTVLHDLSLPNSAGVRVAAGDVDGDEKADIITLARNGLVQVHSGDTGLLVDSYAAFGSPVKGNLTLAAGDANGDGLADVVTAVAGARRTRVRVRSSLDGAILHDEVVAGPRRVGITDRDDDGLADVVLAASKGGKVRVLSGLDLGQLDQFFAFGRVMPAGIWAGGTVV